MFFHEVTVAPFWMQDVSSAPIAPRSSTLRYVMVSAGADGLLQDPWDEISARDQGAVAAVARGATETPDDDIVFADGQFVQWPRGLQP